MRKIILLLLVVVFSSPLYDVRVDAGPAWGKHKKKYKKKHESEDDSFRKMVVKKPKGPFWAKGGPPPLGTRAWLPAKEKTLGEDDHRL